MDEHIKQDMERRLKAIFLVQEQISNNDETVSLVLKTHLFTEYLMEGLLTQQLGDKADPIIQLDLGFSRKLSLVSSYKLIPDFVVASLRRLNKLRNQCVHTLNLNPSYDDVFVIFDGITDYLPYTNYDVSIKKLMIWYTGFVTGYLAPRTWE